MPARIEYPVTNGVTTYLPPPEGYVVNFEHPQEQKVLEHYLIFGLVGSLALVALIQRLYTKVYISTGLQMDDLFMTIAWIFATAMQSTQIWSIAIGGLCHHAWEMPLAVFEKHMISSYIAAPCFVFCAGFTKMSLLAFYLNISPRPWFRRSIWAAFGVVGCSVMIIAPMLLFSCKPIKASWDPRFFGHRNCINASVLYMAMALFNIGADVVIFIIPIPTIVKLKMGVGQKVGAIVLFGTASLTMATAVLRLRGLPILLHAADVPWDAAPANVWAFLEANLCIICGSMPTLRKFAKHVAPKVLGYSSSNHSREPSSARPALASGPGASAPSRLRSHAQSQCDHVPGEGDGGEHRPGAQPGQSMSQSMSGMSVNLVFATTDGAQTDSSANHLKDRGGIGDTAILQTRTVEIRYD